MSSDLDSRTPQFGLRDFLYYLVPGGIILISILLVSDIPLSKLEVLARDIGGFGVSIVGILVAYYLGQFVYPLNYLLKKILNIPRPKNNWEEGNDSFEECHKNAITYFPVYYVAVVFRDRSFSRFSLAMVLPSIFLCFACWRFFSGNIYFFSFLALLSASGFGYRYIHYDIRYKNSLKRCCIQKDNNQEDNKFFEESAS